VILKYGDNKFVRLWVDDKIGEAVVRVLYVWCQWEGSMSTDVDVRTRSNRLWLRFRPRLDFVHPPIVKVAEVDNTVVHDCASSTILLHTGARVELGPKHVFTRLGIHDNAATFLRRPALDVVDRRCYWIDQDIVNDYGLPARRALSSAG
jgi:hypothetical protein